MEKKQNKQKRIGNKGFSLVELIVVIAIMAVLVGILAPTLIGNIQKSKEAKDINSLDNVYTAVNTALADEKGNSVALSAAYKDKYVSLATINTNSATATDTFAKLVMENTENITSFSSDAAKNGEIYVKVTGAGKVSVVIADKTTLAVLEASKSKKAFSGGNAGDVAVGTAVN